MCPWRCEVGLPGPLEGHRTAGMLSIYPRKTFKTLGREHALNLVNIEILGMIM